MSPTRKLSFFVRRLTLKSYNTARPIRFICTSNTCKDAWPQEKETPAKISNQPLGMIPYDYSSLTTKILACSTQTHLFQLINENHDKMKGSEAIKALQTLLEIVKLEDETKKSIKSTEEFATLCEIIKKRVRQLSESDAITALKLLNLLDVPTSTWVVQMLLQIIRNSVNNLPIEQINFLNFLLPKLQKTPLVTALMTALPLVLRSHIKSQLDSENVDTLVKVLCQFTGESYDSDSISIVLKHLSRVDKSAMQPSQARIIMANIPYLNNDDYYIEVLKKCQEVHMDSIHDIEPDDLTAVVSIISHRTNDGFAEMYNKSLLDACAMEVISRDMGLNVALVTLKHFLRIGHAHESLLDYVAEKMHGRAKEDGILDAKISESLITGMSSANYKPLIWDKLETTVEKRLLETSSQTALFSAMHLASIDCYWPKLLEKVFTTEHYYQNDQMRSRFLLLYKAVKTLHPEYDGPWPLDEILELYKPRENLSRRKVPFISALECTFGGPEYIITNVKTEMGFTIDHVAIMSKDGVPIAINNANESVPLMIEELKRPEESQPFLFLYIPQQGCLRNIRAHGAFWYLLIRTLEVAINCKVIPLYHEMRRLPDTEKQIYISRAIAEGMNSSVMNPPQSL